MDEPPFASCAVGGTRTYSSKKRLSISISTLSLHRPTRIACGFECQSRAPCHHYGGEELFVYLFWSLNLALQALTSSSSVNHAYFAQSKLKNNFNVVKELGLVCKIEEAVLFH